MQVKEKDILEKYGGNQPRREEWERSQIIISFGFGGTVVALLCVLFSVLRAVKHQLFHEFGVILFSYMAAVGWRSYHVTRKKSFLAQGIACSIVALSSLAVFICLEFLT